MNCARFSRDSRGPNVTYVVIPIPKYQKGRHGTRMQNDAAIEETIRREHSAPVLYTNLVGLGIINAV